MVFRKIAVAIPALNEAERIVACLTALIPQHDATNRVGIVVLTNNCRDQTADIVRAHFGGAEIYVREISLLRPHNHAGWARRLSIEAAAEFLDQPADVLLCTDADTVVANDWIKKNLAYLDGGFDAVAGFAVPSPAEWHQLNQRTERASTGCGNITHCWPISAVIATTPWPTHGRDMSMKVVQALP